ncbi:nitroreductase family protein [Amycolatopsis sp. PS_44_ISF1]|uniref:nitroreductase family protein n=1 Tax=Amycolatopsis sp. PS_44_ISF1 TaxID=2974917 RepID=UPI0028E07B00|nr:nitroreductase family protein [Amycolatopsis sp. PS_44_ISF1]MDT8912136.1 nitroreductase family protein [Amycolatopsis sp. PS_44_ISF1]
MEFTEALRGRRMVRSYRPDPVAEDVLGRVVRMVHRAPSGGFSQGHRLVVITAPEPRRRIAEISERPYGERGFPAWISKAPVHLALGVREASYHERYQQPDKLDADGAEIAWPVPYWWFDSGALLTLIQLAAADEGLATGFFGPDPQRLAELRATVGFPDDVALAGIVTLGYGAEEPDDRSSRTTRARLPLDELVTWVR